MPTLAIQPVNCSRALRTTGDIARPVGWSGGLGGLVEFLDTGGELKVAVG